MRLMAVVALASGFVAAPMIAAGGASALPPVQCDGADCVPGVPRDATLGGHCNGATRYDFGLDAAGNTYICTMTDQWVKTKPLVGVRLLSAPCNGDPGSAQTPDGLPVSCKDGGWRTDFDAIFYKPTG